MSELRYSRNCEEISIHNFQKISDSGDYRYIVPTWDEFEEIEVDEIKAENLWKDIYDEYCQLSDDNKIIMFYDTYNDLNKMQTKKALIQQLLLLFVGINDKEVFDKYNLVFTELGYPLLWEKGIEAEFKRITNAMRRFDNMINIKQSQLDSLKPEGGPGTPFLEQVVQIENMRKMGAIDLRKTSAKKWIYILKNISKNVK